MLTHISRRLICLLCLLLMAAGCAKSPAPDPEYRTQSVYSDPSQLGGSLRLPKGNLPAGPDPNVVQAQELKLKVKEMASQLLETWPGDNLSGLVALPTSFVQLDNFQQSSPLGRYLAEALIYEFNTRGFAVQEYRLTGEIAMNPGGEFALSRALAPYKLGQPWQAVVVGTYYRDQYSLLVNARLVRSEDGLVLRSAELVLPMNGLLARMSWQNPLRTGSTAIVPGK